MRRVRHHDGQPVVDRDLPHEPVEARQGRDPPQDGLGRQPRGREPVPVVLDLGHADAQELRRLVGPAELQIRDERHHVLAIGALRVRALAAGDPAFEHLGHGVGEALDLAGDGRGVAAEQDRRRLAVRVRFPGRSDELSVHGVTLREGLSNLSLSPLLYRHSSVADNRFYQTSSEPRKGAKIPAGTVRGRPGPGRRPCAASVRPWVGSIFLGVRQAAVLWSVP